MFNLLTKFLVAWYLSVRIRILKTKFKSYFSSLLHPDIKRKTGPWMCLIKLLLYQNSELERDPRNQISDQRGQSLIVSCTIFTSLYRLSQFHPRDVPLVLFAHTCNGRWYLISGQKNPSNNSTKTRWWDILRLTRDWVSPQHVEERAMIRILRPIPYHLHLNSYSNTPDNGIIIDPEIPRMVISYSL